MKILGIETSCDETAAAVVKDGVGIVSNTVASSAEMHAISGGIIPEKAAREQVRSVIPVIQRALGNLQKTPDIDAIAVTVGPGLIGSLLVGVETAKTLSHLWNKPIIPVNHLVGHIYANFLREGENLKVKEQNLPTFPALCLLVSGGHTDLVLMKNHGKFTWLGGTRDDAAGEAFDKCSRLLGLGYPGGPAIANEAMKFETQNSKLEIKLPRPMIDEDNFDWSFSGLKTAVLNRVKGKTLNEKEKQALAFDIQEAICDCLITKTLKAVRVYQPKSLLLAGGVAANGRLREKFMTEIKTSKLKINFLVPPPKYCTDNAAYIASCAFYNFKPVSWEKIDTNPALSIMDY